MDWNPTESDKGFIAGTVEMERLEDESGFTHYLLSWGKDSETRMDQYPILAQYEVRGIRDGIMEKDLKIETLGPMDQKLNITAAQDEGLKLTHKFTEKQRIPIGATHLLLLSQRKFWFEEDAERKIGKVIASVPIDKTNFEVVESAVTDGSLETGVNVYRYLNIIPGQGRHARGLAMRRVGHGFG